MTGCYLFSGDQSRRHSTCAIRSFPFPQLISIPKERFWKFMISSRSMKRRSNRVLIECSMFLRRHRVGLSGTMLASARLFDQNVGHWRKLFSGGGASKRSRPTSAAMLSCSGPRRPSAGCRDTNGRFREFHFRNCARESSQVRARSCWHRWRSGDHGRADR